MKAIVQDRYGSPDVLRLQEIDKPAFGDDDVLVRVRAASVHPDVWHLMVGQPYALRFMGAGVLKPKNRVPGTDMAGQVEAVGKSVTRFQAGDEVFGETISGYQWVNGGAFAEYVAVRQDYIALKPGNITFEQAAAVPTSGLIALHNLRDNGQVKAGQRVLINGAGGGVGAIALQLAKAYGANVTGVDSAEKGDMIRSLGADQVIDYAQHDFTHGDERYDLILDVPGNHPFSDCRRALTPTGIYVLIGHEHFGESGHPFVGLLPYFFKLVVLSRFVSQLPKPNFQLPNKKESMAVLKDFLEAGKITPVIDRTFTLSDVAEAMRYLQGGRARGKIVITV
jgi:NADPH:quinone reductase-like Zn-dependent oxidoreductase